LPFSRGLNRGPRRSSRQTAWEEGPGSSTSQQFVASTTILQGSGAQAGVDGVTIVRTRGHLSALLTAVAAANEGFHCAIGICVVTVDAFTVGVTAVPNPIADMSWDGWLYHRFFDVHSISGTIADGVNAGTVGINFEVDSKAMRKIGINEVVVATLEVIENGTAVMEVYFDTRILVKLS